jgi:hypothetical protein
MNPFFKAWLQDVLKKAATSGGSTIFDEILATVETGPLMRIRETCDRIIKSRAGGATQVVDESPPKKSGSK